MKNRIKEKRNSLGLTQKELANKTSVSRQYISAFERTGDYNPPSLKVANEIASALDTCIYDIFDLDGSGNYSCPYCNKKNKTGKS